MCPNCGAHLEDTWTGDECESCGFAYVHETETATETETSGEPRVVRQPATTGPSTRMALVAVLFGWVGGALVTPISVTPPESGGVGMLIEFGPGSEPLLAAGLLAVAAVAITASSVRRGAGGGETA